MTKGAGCPLAIRADVGEARPCQSQDLPRPPPSSRQPGLMMAGLRLTMMTGLSKDVFLPSGQIAVGTSGAFFMRGGTLSWKINRQLMRHSRGNWHK